MSNKLVELNSLLSGTYSDDSYDIVAVTETWLGNEVPDTMVCSVADYLIFRKDRRGRVGGGVCFFIRKNLNPVLVPLDDQFTDLELLAVDLVQDKVRIRLLLLYRPPDTSTEIDYQLHDCFNSLLLNYTGLIYVLGDFNLPGINWDTLRASGSLESKEEQWLHMLTSLGLSQLVSEPTRLETILDLFFTSDISTVISLQTGPNFSTSDHCSVLFSLHLPSVTRKAEFRKTRNFFKADFQAMSEYFAAVQWDQLFANCYSLEDLWICFKDIVHRGIDLFVPFKKVVQQGRRYPKFIRRIISKRKVLWKQRKSDSGAKQYKDVTIQLRNLLKEFSLQQEEQILNSGDLKSFFRFVSTKLRGRTPVATLKTPDHSFVSVDRDKSQLLNTFFASVFTQDDGRKPFFPNRVNGFLSQISFTTGKVLKALKSLPKKTSRTPTDIPALVLRQCAFVLAEPLSVIYQRSFDSGTLPLDWLQSLVCPIYKKGLMSDPGNYRPVSLTANCCKGMERVILCDALSFLNSHKVFAPSQHGFRKFRSTLTQLLESTNDWTLAVKDKKSVDIVYLDFAKAFDTVSHIKLIQKLGSYGLSGRLLAWIKAYLTGRTQRVVINQSESDSLPVISGVPQGGVLSSLLFLLYVNDLPDFVQNSTVKIFADDVKIYLAFSELWETDRLREDLALICQWANEWQLVLAFLKCEILHLGIKNPRTDYFLGLTKLKSKDTLRDLGILMSSSMKFSEHCSTIAAKAMQRTSLLFRVFTTTKVHPYIRAYKAYVRPILEYGSPVWNPHLQGDILRLERVQRYFTRRLLVRISQTPLSYQDRLSCFGLESLRLRRLKTDLIYYYKILNGHIPLDPNLFFTQRTASRTRGHPKKLLVPDMRVDVRKFSFACRSIDRWNSLPNDVILAPSLPVFSKRLNAYLKEFIFD